MCGGHRAVDASNATWSLVLLKAVEWDRMDIWLCANKYRQDEYALARIIRAFE